VDGLMKTRGKGLVPEQLMEAAGARLDQPIDDQILARRIADFFKAPRQAA
jgi:hypothetical protein